MKSSPVLRTVRRDLCRSECVIFDAVPSEIRPERQVFPIIAFSAGFGAVFNYYISQSLINGSGSCGFRCIFSAAVLAAGICRKDSRRKSMWEGGDVFVRVWGYPCGAYLM